MAANIRRVNHIFQDQLTINAHNSFESFFGETFDRIERIDPNSQLSRNIRRDREESAQRAEMARRRIVRETFGF